MIFELVQDFSAAISAIREDHHRRRILTLLEEGIRRDIHFIDRHPTTLFQCLWNTCWWYDSSDCISHFERREPRQSGDPYAPITETHLYQVLEAWQEKKCKATPGFYWLRALRPPLMSLRDRGRPLRPSVLNGHSGMIMDLDVSNDGRFIISAGSEDHTLRVWDVNTGREVHCIRGHTRPIWCVAFSRDGRLAVSGSQDQTVRVWDVESEKELRRITNRGMPFGIGINAVWCAGFREDSDHIFFGSDDGSLRIMDWRAGRAVASFNHGGGVATACFSKDGSMLLTGTAGVRGDKLCRIWDTRSGSELAQFGPHNSCVTSAVFLPDQRQIVSSSRDGTIRVWDIQTCQEVDRLCESAVGIESIALFDDGQQVASAGNDCTVRIWNLKTRKELVCFRGHQNVATGVRVLSDQKCAVSCSADGSVRLWDLDSASKSPPIGHHSAPVIDTGFSLDGAHFASCSGNGELYLWRLGDRRLESVRRLAYDALSSFDFSSDGSQLLVATRHGELYLFDIAAAESRIVARLNVPVQRVRSAPDKRIAVIGCEDNTVHLVDLEMATILSTTTRGLGGIWSLDLSSDGRFIAVGTGDRKCCVWETLGDARPWSFVCGPPIIYDEEAHACATGKRGNEMFSGNAEFDCAYKLAQHLNRTWGVAVASDGQLVATGASGVRASCIQLWSKTTNECIMNIDGISDVRVFLPQSHQVLRLMGCLPDSRLCIGSEIACALAFPGEKLSASNDRQIWAIAHGNDLQVFCVEGFESGGLRSSGLRTLDVATRKDAIPHRAVPDLAGPLREKSARNKSDTAVATRDPAEIGHSPSANPGKVTKQKPWWKFFLSE